MPNLNVAVLGLPGYAKEIGKRSSSTDIAYHELKRGPDSVSLLEPARYPERISSLFYALSSSQFAILVVEKVDNLLGEALLMLDCMGVSEGWLVLRGFLQEEQVRPLLEGTSVAGFQTRPDDPVAMREELLDMAAALPVEAPGKDVPSRGSVPVDQHFNVKGVGTVVLGPLMDGVVRRHDKLRVLPLGETVVLRSIQKHDDDWDHAVAGDRVGLALKGIEADRLDRGQVLSSDPALKVTQELEAEAELVRFWPSPLKEGMVLHLGHWMQVLPCRVLGSKGEDWRRPALRLALDGEMVHPPGATAVLMYLEGGKLRVVGRVTLP